MKKSCLRYKSSSLVWTSKSRFQMTILPELTKTGTSMRFWLFLDFGCPYFSLVGCIVSIHDESTWVKILNQIAIELGFIPNFWSKFVVQIGMVAMKSIRMESFRSIELKNSPMIQFGMPYRLSLLYWVGTTPELGKLMRFNRVKSTNRL